MGLALRIPVEFAWEMEMECKCFSTFRKDGALCSNNSFFVFVVFPFFGGGGPGLWVLRPRPTPPPPFLEVEICRNCCKPVLILLRPGLQALCLQLGRANFPKPPVFLNHATLQKLLQDHFHLCSYGHGFSFAHSADYACRCC